MGLACLAVIAELRGDAMQTYDGRVRRQPLAEAVARRRLHIVGISAGTIPVKAAWRHADIVRSPEGTAVVPAAPHDLTVVARCEYEMTVANTGSRVAHCPDTAPTSGPVARSAPSGSPPGLLLR